MDNLPIIITLYAERRYFWRIVNSIADMAEEETNLSLEFKQYINAMRKKMDHLYLEATDAYYETKESYIMIGTDPEVLFVKELNRIIKETERKSYE